LLFQRCRDGSCIPIIKLDENTSEHRSTCSVDYNVSGDQKLSHLKKIRPFISLLQIFTSADRGVAS
jgi:hypothetical protein